MEQRAACSVVGRSNPSRELGELCYREGGYLVFDAKGNIDHESGSRHAGMVIEGLLGDRKSFAASRAKHMKQDFSWSPTGDQLQQMIALVKKRA